MPKLVRVCLLASIALAYGYLALHAGEPLRLAIGDPWSDAEALASLGDLVGIREIAVYRVLALAVSALAAWLLFQYLRRLWDDRVALIATALWTTTLVWLMYADSLQRAPIMHASCFLALWGVVRAIETERRRYHAAAFAGTLACLVSAPNDWLFLPVGVLFTVYAKRGNPFAGRHWRVIAVCAAAAVLAALLRPPFTDEPAGWQTTLDERVADSLATLLRRYTALLSPMLWVTLAYTVWRGLRAPSVTSVVQDGMTWMLVAAAVFAYLPAPHPESATLRVQLLLPFYAIGSALILARLFDGRRLARALAAAACVLAPLWGIWLLVSHPREVLDRDDVARANAYLASHDGSDFVISNLLADGPLYTALGRHAWEAPREPETTDAHARMLELFEAAGATQLHAVIFRTPGSRFVDRSIAQVMRRRMASVDGWPYLVRAKVEALIAGYDRLVRKNLDALGAQKVLELSGFDIYRIDRATVLERAAATLPIARMIDFDSLASTKFQLLGWGHPLPPAASGPIPSSIRGYSVCRNPIISSAKPVPNGCSMAASTWGLSAIDAGTLRRAELLVRVERACELELAVTLAAPAPVELAFNGTTILSCRDPQWGAASLSVRVPASAVRPGANVLSLGDAQSEPQVQVRPRIASVAISPRCD